MVARGIWSSRGLFAGPGPGQRGKTRNNTRRSYRIGTRHSHSTRGIIRVSHVLKLADIVYGTVQTVFTSHKYDMTRRTVQDREHIERGTQPELAWLNALIAVRTLCGSVMYRTGRSACLVE